MRRVTVKVVLAFMLVAGMILGAVSPVAASDTGNERFIKALKAQNLGWRVSAAQALGNEREAKAVEPLIKMLKEDENYAARVSAAVALAKIGDVRALRALKNAARHDRDQTVRTVAKGAYSELKKISDKYAEVE